MHTSYRPLNYAFYINGQHCNTEVSHQNRLKTVLDYEQSTSFRNSCARFETGPTNLLAWRRTGKNKHDIKIRLSVSCKGPPNCLATLVIRPRVQSYSVLCTPVSVSLWRFSKHRMRTYRFRNHFDTFSYSVQKQAHSFFEACVLFKVGATKDMARCGA
jgi:hypothetical protein